ncbi:MAG TPA: hypothetical protein DIW61_06990, partial [Candidatus Aminicenantes bacterium]|nr:hypothetical protein [Candidatus Aminicenantes bacterium]
MIAGIKLIAVMFNNKKAIFLISLVLLPGLAFSDGKISLRFHGGWTFISGGDANHGTQSYFDYHKSLWPESSGGFRTVHNGYEAGGDIVFELTPRLGLGIGGGYMNISRSSRMSLSIGLSNASVFAKPSLSAVPIRGNAYFNMPLSKRLNLLADVGLSYYFKARYRDELTALYWVGEILAGYTLITTRAEYKKTPISFQGGISLEYAIWHNFFPFLEARIRYARFCGWKGTSVLESSFETPLSEQGILYYEVVPTLLNEPRLLMVQSSPPDGPGGHPRQAA